MTAADEQPRDPCAAGEDDDGARWTLETDDAAAGAPRSCQWVAFTSEATNSY